VRSAIRAGTFDPRGQVVREITPTTKYRGHSAESKAAYHRVNLRWHDLRHEYASRLIEQGVPLAQVRDLLGHASITTTER
jgi:site-specific recombinase XerD